MALKPCRECGAKISTEAKSCPKCGAPKPILNKFSSEVSLAEPNLNYFLFFLIFLGTIFFTIKIPDSDFVFQSLIGHRSIITHSILFPFLIYHYYLKKINKPNTYLTIFVIGFFTSIALHLSADLYPKGWKGTAFIKLPGNNSIGEGLSIVWMFINVIFGTYFSSKIFIQLASTKKYFIPYLFLGSLSAIIYSDEDGGDVEAKFFTFIIIFLITFFYVKRKSGRVYLKKKEIVNKKEEKKRRFFGGFWTYLIGTIIIIPSIIFLIVVIIGLFYD